MKVAPIASATNGPLFFTLGHMQVLASPPAKLLKALAVIAGHLHDLWDASGWTAQGKSKESCILSAMTVREFLYRVGFKTADCRPCAYFMDARRGDEQVWSVGVGDPESKPKQSVRFNDKASRWGWNGHLVVTVDGWLIDPTLYQAARPQYWPDWPGMMAVPLYQDASDERLWGLKPLTGGAAVLGDLRLIYTWLDHPENTDWTRAPDAINKHHRRRIADQMVTLFGGWDE